MQPQSRPKRPVGVIVIAVIAAAGGVLSLFGGRIRLFRQRHRPHLARNRSSHLRHPRPITRRRILHPSSLGLDRRNHDLHRLDAARNSGDSLWWYYRRSGRRHKNSSGNSHPAVLDSGGAEEILRQRASLSQHLVAVAPTILSPIGTIRAKVPSHEG